jgi:hypothetical protein
MEDVIKLIKKNDEGFFSADIMLRDKPHVSEMWATRAEEIDGMLVLTMLDGIACFCINDITAITFSDLSGVEDEND